MGVRRYQRTIMRGLLKNILLLAVFTMIFALSQIVVGFVVIPLSPAGIDDFCFMCIYFFSMILCYLAITILERRVYGRVVPIDNSRRGCNPVTILAGVVLLFAISILLAPLGEILPVDSREFPDGPFTLITIVVLAPIFEEMIFRGRLYNIFHHNGSPLTAATLSALAFGLVHLEPYVIIEALVVGVVFSYYYIAKRSIFTPILLHMCNNAFAYALLVLSYRGESLLNLLGDGMMITIAYGVSAAIVAVCAIIVFRRLIIERRNERRVIEEEEEIDE